METGSSRFHTGIKKTTILVSIRGLPYRNGDTKITIWKWGLTVPTRGLQNHWSPFRYGDYRMVTGTHKSPYWNGDSPFLYRGWNDIDTHSDTGITRDYRMVTGIPKSPYGNGVFSFPYGDCKDINPRMEMGITRDYHIETGTGTSPSGNETWPLPYRWSKTD